MVLVGLVKSAIHSISFFSTAGNVVRGNRKVMQSASSRELPNMSKCQQPREFSKIVFFSRYCSFFHGMATYWENSCSFGLRYVSWYKCLIVSLVFSHLGFWSGNLFLIAPFPDLCLLVPLYIYNKKKYNMTYHVIFKRLHRCIIKPEDQWSCKRSPDVDSFTCIYIRSKSRCGSLKVFFQ